MKFITILLTLFLALQLSAQSKLSTYTGATLSQLQVAYPSNTFQGLSFDNFTAMQPLVRPYWAGIEYEYDYKKLRVSTGLSFMTFGAAKGTVFPNKDWTTLYAVLPILAGYHLILPKQWGVTLEGGVEVGFQEWTSISTTIGHPYSNVAVHAVAGIEGEWRRWRLGLRGHWGMTDFSYLGNISYRQAGLTLYLGYTFWDWNKVQERYWRKRKEREQQWGI